MLPGAVKPVFCVGGAGMELACDVALEAADGFGFGLAFGAAALQISRVAGSSDRRVFTIHQRALLA